VSYAAVPAEVEPGPIKTYALKHDGGDEALRKAFSTMESWRKNYKNVVCRKIASPSLIARSGFPSSFNPSS